MPEVLYRDLDKNHEPRMKCPHCGKTLRLALWREGAFAWHECYWAVGYDPLIGTRHNAWYITLCRACGEPVS